MKKTSGNDKFLCGVKIMMNDRIYKRTSKIYNDSHAFNGLGGAVTYLQQFFNKQVNAKYFEDFAKK